MRRRVIDLHCHLLPGIDDGPADLGGTLAMAQQHVKAGVEVVAATPHVAWDMPNDAATIDLRLADVHAALAAAEIPLRGRARRRDRRAPGGRD